MMTRVRAAALAEFILPYDAVRLATEPDRCCWTSCRAPMKLVPVSEAGTGPGWQSSQPGPVVFLLRNCGHPKLHDNKSDCYGTSDSVRLADIRAWI